MVTRAARARCACCAVLTLGLPALPAAAEITEVVALHIEGRDFEVELHRPALAARGTVVLAHGFLRDRHSMSMLAHELADRGALVIVPDLPYFADPVANSTAVAAIVIELRAGRFGPVPARTVLIGFSAGGLASLLATARIPGITGWIGLDPVDQAGEGLHVAARVSAPAVMLRAAPHSCNGWANSHGWGSFLPHLKRDALVEGATHCDFENPGDFVCAAVCGTPDPQRQALIRAEVTAAVADWLQ